MTEIDLFNTYVISLAKNCEKRGINTKLVPPFPTEIIYIEYGIDAVVKKPIRVFDTANNLPVSLSYLLVSAYELPDNILCLPIIMKIKDVFIDTIIHYENSKIRLTSSLLDTIKQGVLTEFSYPYGVIKRAKDEFTDFMNILNDIYPKSFASKLIDEFFLELLHVIIHYKKSLVFLELFVKALKKTITTSDIWKNDIFTSSKQSFNFSLAKANPDSLSQEVYDKISQVKKKFNYNNVSIYVFDVRMIVEQQQTFATVKKLFKTEKENEISKNLITLNSCLIKSFLVLTKYFLEDAVHSYRLGEVVEFQNRVEKILNALNSRVSLDTTRSFANSIISFLKFLGLDKNDLTFYQAGKVLTEANIRSIWAHPDHIVIQKGDKLCQESPKRLVDLAIAHLQDRNIPFDREENVFKNIPDLDRRIALMTEAQYRTDITFSPMFVKDARGRSIPRTKSLSLIPSDFYKINKNGSEFRVASFKEILQNMIDKTIFEVEINKAQAIEFKIFSFIDNPSSIEITLFDMIEYFQELADEILKFFSRELNIKAITERRQLEEQYDGTRGYLDVESTIRASLNKGFIVPMQRYKERLIKTPPILYLLFDISGSMHKVFRNTQFLITIILSFFEKETQKFFLGYITSMSREKLFPSDFENRKLRERRKKQWKVRGDNAVYENIAKKMHKSINVDFFGELGTDYNDYQKAMDDFLGLEEMGAGTSFTILNLVPSHPDMDINALKYVFIVTDAEFASPEDKLDFIRVMNELTSRDDVRIMFLWILEKNQRISNFGDAIDEILEQEAFVTKQSVMRAIETLLTSANGRGLTPEEFNTNRRADLEFLVFVYNNWNICHIVSYEHLALVGEIKHILEKLVEQDFFLLG